MQLKDATFVFDHKGTEYIVHFRRRIIKIVSNGKKLKHGPLRDKKDKADLATARRHLIKLLPMDWT